MPLTPMSSAPPSVQGYRAITENVPKIFPQALRDPVWCDLAQLEFETILISTKSLVRMDNDIARQQIQQGAEVLYMKEKNEGRKAR